MSRKLMMGHHGARPTGHTSPTTLWGSSVTTTEDRSLLGGGTGRGGAGQGRSEKGWVTQGEVGVDGGREKGKTKRTVRGGKRSQDKIRKKYKQPTKTKCDAKNKL